MLKETADLINDLFFPIKFVLWKVAFRIQNYAAYYENNMLQKNKCSFIKEKNNAK